MGLDIFENEGTSKKGCVEIADWGFSVHFGGFKKIPFTLDTCVLVAKILQNGAKFGYIKSGFKNYSLVLKFDGLLSKKIYSFS